ncbi:MAG: PAS domain S-box protein, partial [candidate division Zixibacteria bacterium]|nr:PAS domain S-box protein [candidate division Zixibacteria bacterium]
AWLNTGITDEDGNVTKIVAVGRDITDKKKAEDALKAITSRNDAILGSVPDIIMEVDNNKIYTWTNRAGYEFFGDDVIGKPADHYFEGEQQVYKTVQPLFNGSDDAIFVESWQRNRHGEKRLLAWWCRILKDSSGNVTGALSTARDITESNKIEEALRESEERFRFLFQSSSDCVVILDRELNYIHANKSANRYLGLTNDTIEGKSIKEALSRFPDFRDLWIERLSEYFKSGQPDWVEDSVKVGDEIAWSESSLSPIKDSNDKIVAVGIIYRDITERKQTESLIKTQRDLGVVLSKVHGLRETLDVCLETAIEISSMDCGGIYLINELTGDVELISSINLPNSFIESASNYASNSKNAKLIKKGYPVYGSHHKLGLPLDNIRSEENLKAIAIIPVVHEDQVIACVNVASHSLGEVPDQARTAVETIASQVGAAIARSKIEQALKENEAALMSIFKAAPVGIGLVSEQRVLKRVNTRICEMTGFSREELINKNARILYPTQEEFERVGRLKYDHINKWGTGTIETKWRSTDGRIIDILLSSTPINPDDLSIGVTFTALDITEMKNTLEALKLSENNYRTIFNSAYDAIFIHDIKTGEIIDVNEKMCNMYGYTIEEARKINVETISSGKYPYNQAKAIEKIRKVAAGYPQAFEWLSRSKDGRLFWVDVSLSKIQIGDTYRIIAVVRDIDEKKKAEKREAELLEKLVQSEKMAFIGTMAAGVAHEINNPLTVLSGMLQQLISKTPQDDPLHQKYFRMRKVSDRIGKTVDGLLLFSRQKKVRVEPTDINEFIYEMIELVKEKASFEGIELKMKLVPNLPKANIMREQISQVLINLMRNGLDAMRKGGVLTISTEHLAEHNQIQIDISDTGVGISSSEKKKIFNPFYTTKDVGHGTGLGLAISYGIIESHQGFIDVESVPGEGTTFSIRLPLELKEVDRDSMLSFADKIVK